MQIQSFEDTQQLNYHFHIIIHKDDIVSMGTETILDNIKEFFEAIKEQLVLENLIAADMNPIDLVIPRPDGLQELDGGLIL